MTSSKISELYPYFDLSETVHCKKTNFLSYFMRSIQLNDVRTITFWDAFPPSMVQYWLDKMKRKDAILYICPKWNSSYKIQADDIFFSLGMINCLQDIRGSMLSRDLYSDQFIDWKWTKGQSWTKYILLNINLAVNWYHLFSCSLSTSWKTRKISRNLNIRIFASMRKATKFN